MKHLKRVVALILTVVLAVYGLPMTPMAFAVESMDETGEAAAVSTLPSTAMRFVQTNFDESTGILTMSLQIKPNPGENDETVREGVFLFQVDATRVVPMTNPRADGGGVTWDELKEFKTYSGEIAAALTVDSFSTQVIKDFAESGSKYVNLVSTSNKFDLTMSSTNMFSKYTGLLVSGTRFQKGESTMVDCYFQFYLDLISDIKTNEDGYVNIIDLNFQCYDTDGVTKATSTEVLSAGSIRMPEADEIDDILKQFSFKDSNGETVSMAMGAAGFVQQYESTGGLTAEGNAYYYYNKQPEITKWRKNGGTRSYWAKTPYAATTLSENDTVPGIWYENCEKKYLVEELHVSNANTMEGDIIEDPNTGNYTMVTNPDFTYPTGSNGSIIESGRYPRYSIPSYTQSLENDSTKNWIPEAYQGNGKRPALKYYAGTSVAAGSITTPEEDDFTGFVEDLQWQIVLQDGTQQGTSLEDIEVTEVGGEGKLVETGDGVFYRVKEATVTDEDHSTEQWFGKYVWNVYKVVDKDDASLDEYLMKMPVGITLDFIESDVTYVKTTVSDGNIEETEIVNRVKAPQLHMTYEAADTKSVIWNTNAANTTVSGEKCTLGLRAVYIDGDRKVYGETISIGLYKNDATPSTIEIYDGDTITDVANAQGATVDGFWIGNEEADGTGEETPNDIVANGAGISVVLYDQYHVGYETKFPTVELVPTAETEKAYKNAGKTNPFIIERTEGNEYTIIYRDGANANDAVKGEYVIKATYTSTDGSKVVGERKVYINRSDDKLSYVRVGLSYNHNLNSEQEVDGGIIYDITYNVPVRSGDNKTVTASETVTIMEIANQWRDKETVPDDLSKYDVLRNVRKTDGTSIDIAKARAAGCSITIEATTEDGTIPQGIDVSKINSTGDFTFNTNTLDGTKLNIKVTVSYNGYSRFVEYHITFARELQKLSQVMIYTPNNQPSYKITVPLKTESDAQQIIEVVPLDQYGSTWNWEDVTTAYTPGNRLNPDASAQPYDKWSVFVDGTLPEGVSLLGENNNIIVVSKEAKNSEFKIYAKFANARSESVTVEIVRSPSKPTTVSALTYNDTNEIVSPPLKRSNVTVNPTIKVYDQYDEEMTDFTQTWKCTITSDAKDAANYIHLDTKTGELTVDKCAPNCTLTITVRYSANGGTKSQKCTVQVKRETTYADSVAITTASVPYPTLTSTETIQYMSAEATTQYGENEQLASGTVNWALDSVEFADATLYRTKMVDGNEVETGDIPYNSLTGVYSARGMISVTNHGGISFSRTTIENNVPRAITVTVTTNNSEKATKRIVISRETSVPNTLYISEDIQEYKNGIQLPHKGSTATVALQAYVRDQYGVVMNNADIVWNNIDELPDGVKLDKTAKTITIDHTTSENASISLSASCKVSESKTLTKTLYLSVFTNEPLVAQAIEIVGVKDSSENSSAAVDDEVEMTLPAQASPGYSTYTAICKVKDQFDRPVQKAVKWSVVGADAGVDARISDEAAGMVRLYYTEDALNTLVAGGKLTFTMRAEAAENSTVYKDMKVSLKLNEAVATYASPILVTNEGIGNINTDGEPIVPKKGEAVNSVKISTVVYDQYGRVMSGEQGELELLTSMTGLTFNSLVGTGSGLLNIASNVTGTMVTLRATPKNKSSNINDNSTLQIRLNKGTAYAAELALNEDNEYTFDIPVWISETMNNSPDEDTYETLTLGAKIVDQYGAEMTSSSNMYLPTWEFVGEHDGIEFDTGGGTAEGDEKVDGQTVTLRISNRSVPQGKMSDTVTIKVKAGNMSDESFTKTFTITLSRDAAKATFFYIQGADEDGIESEPPMRPHADEKKTVYQFKPTVYDQYGASMDVEGIVMNMNIAALEAIENIEVEGEYNRGESAENGNEPIKYHVYEVIYKDENDTKGTKTLLADFDRTTGELTIYTECDCIDQFVFTAKYSVLGVAGEKTLVVPVGQEELRAYTVKVNRSYGDFKIRGSEDPIYDYIYTTIYDQYGDEYSGGVSVVWNLFLNEKDDKGNYKTYDSELDKDGNERLGSEFLVQKEDSKTDNTITLKVLPESFYEAKSFMLECIVVDNNCSGDRDKWVFTYTPINVRKPSSGSSGITVTFDPGEYGKLVGEATVTVGSGSAPEKTPGVKTVEGYGFLGWTSDGVSIVDATQIALFGDTVYSAVYKDITGTKFVEGYDDMTIRPENHITRAEFVTMVVRAIGGYDSSKDYGSSFADVTANSWYANTIAYAKQMNLIDGYEDGTFKPNNSITRAEAAKILAEAAGLSSENTGTFPDVAEGRWYTEYIEALAEHGVLIGYADGTFRPDNKITRAEAIKMIVMITVNAPGEFERNNIQNYAYCAFTDIRRTHWAYVYILRGAGVA